MARVAGRGLRICAAGAVAGSLVVFARGIFMGCCCGDVGFGALRAAVAQALVRRVDGRIREGIAWESVTTIVANS